MAQGQPWVEGSVNHGTQFWNSLPLQTKKILNNNKPLHQQSDAQKAIKSGLSESWDNTILRSVLCYGSVSAVFANVMGNNPHNVLKATINGLAGLKTIEDRNKRLAGVTQEAAA